MYKLFNSKDFFYNIRQLKYLPRAIKYRWQRAWRGWADCDTWAIDDWFMEVMPQMIKHLNQTQQGYFELLKDGTEEDNARLWSYTLNKMHYLLTEMNKDTCSQQCEYNYKDAEYWPRRKEIEDYRDKCKDEFFEMFSEHFWRLWD